MSTNGFQGKVLPAETPLFSKYENMSKDLKENPLHFMKYHGLIHKLLEPLSETKGEVVIEDNGKCHIELGGMPFADFGVILLTTIRTYTGECVQYSLELLIISADNEPKVVQVEFRELNSHRWIDNLGPSYLCESWGANNLKFIIQTMSKYAPVEEKFLYSGWMPGHASTYIWNNERLNGEDYRLDSVESSCNHTLEMLNVAPHSLTIPLLAVSLLSLVHSEMVKKGVYFKGVCCIVAPTQSFKTTLASLFFDFENGRETDINFEATGAAIVRTIGNVRDSTVIVDDYKPGATKAESNDMTRKLSTVVRMCSDDSGGIQKAGAQNTTISNTARGLVVVTAEQIELQVQSTLARLLVLEMNQKSVDIIKLSHFQESHQQYREFIRNFIRYIASQGVDHFCERLAQRFLQKRNALRNMIPEDTPVDNRTNDMCVWLWITFCEFLEFALCVNAIDQNQFEKQKQECLSVFLSLMEHQAERVADLNPVKQFFKGLQVLIDTKEVRIRQLQARNSNYAATESREAVGFSKADNIYLKNEVAFQAVNAYYRRQGREFSISENSLRKALADNNFILINKSKTYIHRLYINGEKYQCIKFECKKFNELLQGGKSNGCKNDREIPGNRERHENADTYLGRGE